MDLASLCRLFLLAAIWGGSFMLMRVGVPVFGPVALIGLRVAIGALFLWLAGMLLKKRLAFAGNARHFFVIGLLNSALPFLLFAYAARTLSASLLSILNATAPLFGALVATLFLGARLTRSMGAGLVCGFAGVVLLVGAGFSLAGDWTALAAALVAPLSYSLASTYAKAFPNAATPYGNAHGSMWMATLIVLPLLLVFPPQQTPAAQDWSAVASLGVVCTGAAYLLYFRLIEDVGPTRALSVAFLIPVFGVLWGALFLGEAIGWNAAAGGALILAGIALTSGVFNRRP